MRREDTITQTLTSVGLNNGSVQVSGSCNNLNKKSEEESQNCFESDSMLEEKQQQNVNNCAKVSPYSDAKRISFQMQGEHI